jgi:hypothetical protein
MAYFKLLEPSGAVGCQPDNRLLGGTLLAQFFCASTVRHAQVRCHCLSNWFDQYQRFQRAFYSRRFPLKDGGGHDLMFFCLWRSRFYSFFTKVACNFLIAYAGLGGDMAS